MQKPIWFKINKKELEEFPRDIYNTQDNNVFKIIINRRTYDLKNAKLLDGITTHKTTKSVVKKLYNELIQREIEALEREKIDAKREKIGGIRKYILNILKNVGSIFTAAYLHYKNVPKETTFERSIAERIKLRRSDEIKRKE